MDGSWKLEGKDRKRHEKYRDLVSTGLLLADLDIDVEVSKGFGISDIHSVFWREAPCDDRSEGHLRP